MASIRKEIVLRARAADVWSAVRDVGAAQRLFPGVVASSVNLKHLVSYQEVVGLAALRKSYGLHGHPARLPAHEERAVGAHHQRRPINGLVGFAGKSAYNTAKHGLLGLTKVTALEAAPFGNVTVNALCPGYVDTVRNQLGDLARTRGVPIEKVIDEVIFPLVPMKKLLTVQDIADYAHVSWPATMRTA